MDADGLEILDGFRAAGVPARACSWTWPHTAAWERYGTNSDAKGQPLKPTVAKHLPHLTTDESELYRSLASPDWMRHRRVEQERIPLECAREQVLRLIGAPNQ